MMDEQKKLIDAYSQLDISMKRKELGRELAEATVMVYKLLADVTGVNNVPNMDEFNNLYDGTISEDQYLTGFYEDFLNYRELLAIYLDKTISEEDE